MQDVLLIVLLAAVFTAFYFIIKHLGRFLASKSRARRVPEIWDRYRTGEAEPEPRKRKHACIFCRKKDRHGPGNAEA